MKNKCGFSAQQLKMIAILAMTADHLLWVIFPGYGTQWWLVAAHVIGRLTAPIMCFFISEGYHHTKNVKRYLLRLFIFAWIGHFAYNFAFGIPFIPFSGGEVFNQTGVMWALFLGAAALAICDDRNEKLPRWAKIVGFLLCCALAFPADWSCIAVLVVALLYSNRGNFKRQMLWMLGCVMMYAAVYFIFIDMVYGILQMAVVICIPFLSRYNGTRGRGGKWFFYWYYPAHLVLCGLLRLVLHGNVSVMIGG